MSEYRGRGGIAVSIVFLVLTVVVVGGLIAANATGAEFPVSFGRGGADGEAIDLTDVDKLEVYVTDARVSVTSAQDGQAGVFLTGDITATREGGTVLVQQDINFFALNRWGRPQSVEIRLPQGSEVQVLLIESASGSVEVSGLACGSVKVGTASGSVRASEMSVREEMRLSALSGSVRAQDISARIFTAGTASGSVRLSGLLSDSVSAETASGSITAQLEGHCQVNVSTVSGSVEVSCPEAMFGKLGSISGRVRLDAPEDQSLYLSTTSGSLRVDGQRVGDGSVGRTYVLSMGEDEVEITTVSGSISVR